MVEMKAGLEIHQQLDTNKLFCSCPSILRKDKPNKEVERELNPVAGESGKIDIAAAYEKEKSKKFIYQIYDTNCLVELDEEPPHPINQEALDIAIQISLLLNCKIFPTSQVMRKTVIDGSNTSGFQRTLLIAYDGYLDTSQGKVGIETIALEEDAARKINSDSNHTIYRLDRLGIPLVEITTKPDLHNSEQVKEAALKIGEILRACKVKRGIGTIRQDLNVSIPKGNRIEIKGFQEPKIMQQTVEQEITRQQNLLKLQNKITLPEKLHNISNIFKNTDCKILKGKIYAFKLPNMSGLLGKEIQTGKRLGTDLAEQVSSRTNLKGILHSDENLEKYHITQEEINQIKNRLEINKNDAFIFFNAQDGKKIKNIINNRLKSLKKGIPAEVRKSNPDGSTSFLRPMPGAARMYPETDLHLLEISRQRINHLKAKLPKLASEHKAYLQEFGLNNELIKNLLKKHKVDELKSLLEVNNNPKLIAKMLTNFQDNIKLSKQEKQNIFTLDILESILEAVNKNISENDVERVMQQLAEGKTLQEAMKKQSINIEQEVKNIIKQKPNLSEKAYMGLLMSKFKGQISGKEVMQALKKELKP
ncbi:MAG: Glu-tRNA(Gln) amidotransferase subunit GatE [Candidatus Nanoarchaeia archaeon]